jgi:hypothetical protein
MSGMGDLHAIEVGSASGVTTHWKLDDPIEVILDTEAVPLYLARYAVSRSNLRAPSNPVKTPKVSSPFVDPGIPLGTNDHYTLRRLRSGYLYVFSEKDKGWRIFQIRDQEGLTFIQGYQLPARPGSGKPAQGSSAADPDKVQTQNETDRLQHPRADGVLFVPSGTPVWIGFSDAKWTQKTLDDHANEETRRKHMRRFDPAAWRGKPHMTPLGEAEKRVAEAAPGIQKDAFDFSGDAYLRCDPKLFQLPSPVIQWKLGAILALDDPAGIAMDLANLMTARFKDWIAGTDPVYRQPFAASGAKWETPPEKPPILWTLVASEGIEDLKALAENRAVAQTYAHWRSNYQLEQMDLSAFITDWVPNTNPAIRSKILQDVAGARVRAWETYESSPDPSDLKYGAREKRESCYDVQAHKAWKKAFDPIAKDFDQSVMLPLAKAHVAWCESETFRNYFNHVFDRAYASHDAGVGTAFTGTLARCYGGVQDKRPCYEHIKRWLEDDLKDPDKNLLVRALLLNHDETLKMIQAAKGTFGNPRDFPWRETIDFFMASTEKVASIRELMTANLALECTGPLAAVARTAAATGKLTPSLVASGVASGKAILILKLTGEVEHVTSALAQGLTKAFQGRLSGKQAVSVLELKINELREQGVLKGASSESPILLCTNAETIEKMPKEILVDKSFKGIRKKRNFVLSHLSEASAAEELALPGFGKNPGEFTPIEEAVAKASAEERVRVPTTSRPAVMCGVVGAVLQLAACCQISKFLEKAGVVEAAALRKRKNPTGCLAVGATVEVLGKILERIHATGLMGIAVSATAKSLSRTGAFLGMVGGLWMAVVDGTKSWEEFAKGNKALGWLYFASAGIWVGIVAVSFIVLFWGASLLLTGIGWFLAAAAFVVSIAFSAKEGDAIATWLKKCRWGVKPFGERFLKMDDELQGLQAAMGV